MALIILLQKLHLAVATEQYKLPEIKFQSNTSSWYLENKPLNINFNLGSDVNNDADAVGCTKARPKYIRYKVELKFFNQNKDVPYNK